ncbi:MULTISPECIES: hypothetical protein [unclassified Streptomyces]|uniref:hypothetical protein n=1 Tax=unclassified Streptomyces TaxID=2593676 RepID=UPI002035CB29|nr:MULTISPECIES: hypothetical protein [unclassified Streptomyces]
MSEVLRNVDEAWQHVQVSASASADIIRAVDLRPELLPPPVSRQRLEELSCEIDRIADLVTDRPEEADEAIRSFNDATGH